MTQSSVESGRESAAGNGLVRTVAEQPTLGRAFVIAIESRRLVVGFTLMVTFFAMAFLVLRPRTYTSSVSFAPVSSAASLGQLASLAAQAGFALPGIGPSESPQFYADLIRTESLMRELASTTFVVKVGDSTATGNLIDLYEIEESSEGRSLYSAVRRLREGIISVKSNRVTGVITVAARTKWPELSEGLVRHALASVDRFNVVARNSRAREEREFLERNILSARTALRTAEGILEQFLVSNRAFRDDPRLAFQNDRLQRDVAVRQETYVALTRALEQAKIEEVRNTPSISIVDPPSVPLRPDPRGLISKGLFVLLVSFALALGFTAARISLSPMRPAPTIEEVGELANALVNDIAGIPLVGRVLARRLRAWLFGHMD